MICFMVDYSLFNHLNLSDGDMLHNSNINDFIIVLHGYQLHFSVVMVWICIATLSVIFFLAALFLIGHYYENRSAVLVGQGVAAIDIPQSVKSLLDPWRSILFA